jgi:hypothetical protein
MKKVLYLFIGLLAIILLAVLILFNMPQASTQKKDADITTTPEKIFGHFQQDENRANNHYNGKIVQLTGEVLNVSEDQKGAPVIILNANDDFGGVLCTLEKKPKSLPEKGDQIDIKGQCSGFLGNVVLNKCVIIKN